jgi:hypothetical protein
LPRASNTNITKAISVGITSGQPFEIIESEVRERKMSAGNIIPPKAAKLGSKICLICVVSFRSCMPIKKKKGANTSLWAKVSRFIGIVKHSIKKEGP